MCNRNQRFRALTDGAAVEIGDTELGNDVVDGTAGGNHAGAGIQHGHDARNLRHF